MNAGGGGYGIFSHSVWNGLTVADVVFPFFAFAMGEALVLSLNARLRTSMPRLTALKQVSFGAIISIYPHISSYVCIIYITHAITKTRSHQDMTKPTDGVLNNTQLTKYTKCCFTTSVFAWLESDELGMANHGIVHHEQWI